MSPDRTAARGPVHGGSGAAAGAAFGDDTAAWTPVAGGFRPLAGGRHGAGGQRGAGTDHAAGGEHAAGRRHGADGRHADGRHGADDRHGANDRHADGRHADGWHGADDRHADGRHADGWHGADDRHADGRHGGDGRHRAPGRHGDGRAEDTVWSGGTAATGFPGPGARAEPRDGWAAGSWDTASREPAGQTAGAPRWRPPPREPGGTARGEGRHPVRHPVRLALFTLVLAGLVAGSMAWMSMDKSVRLTVDGEPQSISTYASTVGGVLDDVGITVSDHDTLAPDRDTSVSDGAEIVLRRGRLLTLTVDGRIRQVWVTATTVQEALDQIGLRQTGLFVSATRSERLPLDGYQLTLRTPKVVTIVADGRRHRLITTAATVGEAMEEAGVTVDRDDRVSQLASAPVRAGMTVTVTRVQTRTRTTEAVLEYKTIEKLDPDATPGSRTVRTKGQDGLQQVTRIETYVDGRLTSSKVAKITVLRKPVDEVVVVGPEAPEPPPAQPAECADFPTTGGLNWCGLAKCESGLDPNAYNPAGPYYGLYQFDLQTWTAYGGSGSPSGKSIDEQTAVAWTLYQARGASPWPVCGQYL